MYVICQLFYVVGGVLVFIFNRSKLADRLFIYRCLSEGRFMSFFAYNLILSKVHRRGIHR